VTKGGITTCDEDGAWNLHVDASILATIIDGAKAEHHPAVAVERRGISASNTPFATVTARLPRKATAQRSTSGWFLLPDLFVRP
jgi:hypothetical protein